MRKRSLTLGLLLLAVTKAYSADYRAYIDQFKKVVADCSMRYTVKYKMPDGGIKHVSGLMAIRNENYFDSSSTRYVLKNKRWLLVADHLNKFITVTNLERLNKELEGIGTPDISSYLIDDDLFELKMKIAVERDVRDTLVLNVTVPGNTTIEKMRLVFVKSKYQLLSYSTVLNYPMSMMMADDDDMEDDVMMHIEMESKNIVFPAPANMFDESRILSISGKKATLKRYRNYQTILPNSK